jgi:3-keto-L-gulonate-6-phosphate decarboxylase
MKIRRAQKAKKAKNTSDILLCIVCIHRFHTHEELVKHLRTRHKAIAKEITAEFQAARAAKDLNPDEVAVHNYKVALAKVSFLEKYGG